MQPPYLLAVVLSLFVGFLTTSLNNCRWDHCRNKGEWSPQDALPSIPSAKYARAWKHPLFSVGEVKVKGVRINGMMYLESTGIINL